MHLLKRILLPLIVILSFAPAYAKHDYRGIDITSAYEGVTRVVLDNGLTVIVKEDNSAPLVTLRCFVRAGSIHEASYLGSGISHYLEHTMFLGTAKRPNETRIAFEAETLGAGNLNAYTTFDHTAYYFTVLNEYYDEGIELLSDMMENASFPSNAVRREQQTILNEMAMGEDNAERVFSRFFFQSFYTRSPLRYPTIGYREQFLSLTREDLLAYYKRHYAPEHMVLVIIGDAPKDALIASAKTHFGRRKRTTAPSGYIPEEPIHATARTFVSYSPALGVGMAEIAFQTVDMHHTDMYALDLLAKIISIPQTGALEKRLIGKKIAYRARAESWTPSYARGIFSIRAYLPPDGAFERFDEETRAILETIKTQGVSKADLERAKRELLAESARSRDSIESLASEFGVYETLANDYRYLLSYINAITAVTRSDIQRVAARYLTDTARTLVAMLPEERRPKEEPAVNAHINRALPALNVFTLQNGIRVAYRKRDIPTVTVTAYMHGGLLFETETNNGIFALIARALPQGGKGYSKSAIEKTIDAKGGSLTASSSYHAFSVTLETLKSDYEESVPILGAVIREPLFAPNDIEFAHMEIERIRHRNEQDIFSQSGIALKRALYGEHPYALDAFGTAKTTAQLRADDLKAAYAPFAVAENIAIAVVGNIDEHELKAALERAFGTLSNGTPPTPGASWRLPPLTETAVLATYLSNRSQSVVQRAYRGPALFNDPDTASVTVMMNAFAGMGGTLFPLVRGERSLAYTVDGYSSAKVESGTIAFYYASETAKKGLSEANRVIESEIARFVRGNALSKEELLRAINVSKAALHRTLQSPSKEAFALAERLRANSPPETLYTLRDEYEAVTARDIDRVAKKYLSAPYVLVTTTQKD